VSPGKFHLPFEDRIEAGRYLAAELRLRHLADNALVLALTRGGVPVGFSVAERLCLPLDVIVARKLRVPWQPEVAFGAVAGDEVALDKRMTAELALSPEELEEITTREKVEMRRQEQAFREGEPALDVEGRSVLLIDDGLATGYTMLAAIRYVRTLKPARVIVGVPVGSRDACARIRKEADEFVCLAAPEQFLAVGEWYRDFEQVHDTEVSVLLCSSRRQIRRVSAAKAGAGLQPVAKVKSNRSLAVTAR
jgi:putative phosphoribosyl transferase